MYKIPFFFWSETEFNYAKIYKTSKSEISFKVLTTPEFILNICEKWAYKPLLNSDIHVSFVFQFMLLSDADVNKRLLNYIPKSPPDYEL